MEKDNAEKSIGDKVADVGCGLSGSIVFLAIAIGIAFAVLKDCGVLH